MFNPTFWVVTQPWGQNNPVAGFVHILPSTGLYLKVGYVFFQKRFRKLSRAQYQNKLVANQQ